MRLGTLVYGFGGFQLDPASGWLTHGQERVRLSQAQARILLHLIVNGPHVASRFDLSEAGWGGTASDDSIEKAIQHVRNALKPQDRQRVLRSGIRFRTSRRRLN
jgi:DNA-binding winged helix-turn-helix (wHTH) protein